MSDDDNDKKLASVPTSSNVSPPVLLEGESSNKHGRGIKRKKSNPTTGTGASATTKADMNHQITKLLQCLSRGHLESIIASSIQTSTAVTVEDLQQALPVEMQWMATSAAVASSSNTQVVVKPGPSRIGTGLFDDLDDSIVGKILLSLPLQERVLCVTKVCKAWRKFKTFPGLWDDLTAFWRPTRYSQDESSEIPAEWVLQLLNWVPAPQDIRAIIIPSTKSCNPKAVNAILKKLVAVKTKKGSPPLNGLVLSGPKITPAVFNKILDGPLVSPGLTSFTLTKSVKESPLAALVPSLLEKCPNLSTLLLPPHVLSGRGGNGGVAGLISRLSSARGNNPTILQVLDISCVNYCWDITIHHSRDDSWGGGEPFWFSVAA